MNTPKPGDFPIGSVESRAAMRFQLSNQSGESRVLEFVSHISRPWRGSGAEPEEWNRAPRVIEQSWDDGVMRILYVPPGMAEGEARKIAEGR